MTQSRELIVEADGGSRGNPGPAGYGAVVLDPVTGETLAERAEFIGVATNNVAEYKGLVAGLKAARELFPDCVVHVRMDSKLVVEQMSGRWKIKHPDMKPLAAEAARVFPPGRVRYEWMPRERNKHADRLANEAMDAGRRGEQWSPAASTAALAPTADLAAARAAAGDQTAGAAKARAALTGGRGGGAAPAAGLTPSAASPASGGPAAEDSGSAVVDDGLFAASDDGLFAAVEPGTPAVEPGSPAVEPGAPAIGAVTPDEGLFAPDRAVAARARASLAAAATAERESASAPASPTAPATGDFEAEAAHGTASAAAAAPATPSTPSAPGWSAPDMGAPATFVLLRHGETALTPEKRFSGSGGADPELSPAGRRQAEAVAAALAARGTIQEIVSSPLARCRQTAEAVAARLGLDVRIENGLRETDFGAWEGLTFGEVRERYKDDLDAWLASAKAAPTGGGESFATVARRVAATRDRLTAAYAGRTVLLVTHVTPIKTLVRLALGAPPESLFRMELSAASVSAVAYYADGNASVRLLNDTSHLR
ncbi:bifunctional RNase H/acid phosphatase [Streptomyces sp. NPDC048659]|uniref:bifunctional RNase H/acid phosphatase n=1 Tax=Streptomyces sp. NPDC048659 TaxID=3155489 RepID=UPI003432805E